MDSSVALASLFAETTRPPAEFWDRALCSSRLLEYELWTVVNGRGRNRELGDAVVELLSRIGLFELGGEVLDRVLEPFPSPVRTLDAIHLATADFARQQGPRVEFASYDQRQLEVARKLGFDTVVL
ncbi:MAG: PIN domain-containing protein [Gemmatimonadaceae bacterium]